MPCDSVPQTPEWLRQTEDALRRLAASLESGSVSLVIDRASGSIAFKGWESAQRGGLTDLCAYRRLLSENSWPLRLALARAEQAAGRGVNPLAVGSGVHSHDGGASWSSGH
jgi:hypothetical protein